MLNWLRDLHAAFLRVRQERLDAALGKDSRFKLHANSHAVDHRIVYKYDLENGPINQKITLLTTGGTATIGYLSADPKRNAGVVGYYPLPARDKEEERRRGLFTVPGH